MARDLDVDHIYQSQGGKIPIKWTAPEGLKHRQYSSASDVWAYGMCLFEIWTLGRKPYEGTSTDEVRSTAYWSGRVHSYPKLYTFAE